MRASRSVRKRERVSTSMSGRAVCKCKETEQEEASGEARGAKEKTDEEAMGKTTRRRWEEGVFACASAVAFVVSSVEQENAQAM